MKKMNFRNLTSLDLAREFTRVRKLTISILEQFKNNLGPSLNVKLSQSINTPRWEFSHVAWFSERWVLRNKERNEGENANNNKILCPDKTIQTYFKTADELFDSSKLAHDDRWKFELPPVTVVKSYLETTLDKIILQISNENPSSDRECYFYRLALAHEYMHLEAFIMTAQTLKFSIHDCHKNLIRTNFNDAEKLLVKDKNFKVDTNLGFFFDNETVRLDSIKNPFEIDSSPVSIKKFLQFFESGGYNNKSLWSDEGWSWLLNNERNTFINLFISEDCKKDLLKNWFGLNHIINPNFPVLHVSFFEAEAYCNWKKRRLPTELEWMLATNKEEFIWGSVWEWTNDIFKPFRGFRPHPYQEYSKPWFYSHQVVKGSSFATQKMLCNRIFRNFYQKHRNDVFIGFRTVKDL